MNCTPAVALFLLVTITAGYDIELWEQFKKEYGKQYNPKENVLRFNQFQKTKQEIDAHNQLFKDGKLTYSLGINKFADWYPNELESNCIPTKKEHNVDTFPEIKYVNLSVNWDWRKHNAVTHVKDQGRTSWCWIFGSIGAVEGSHAKKTGNLMSLSEQQVGDCLNHSPYAGGWPHTALKYVKVNGSMSEENYPFTGKRQSCYYDRSKVVAQISGFTVKDMRPNEEMIRQILYRYGPVVACLDTNQNFDKYKGGIFDDGACANKTILNHCITIVGFGTYHRIPYWIVKNSWGTSWGVNGYIYMIRDKNMCGIEDDVGWIN